ncbi:hypothetical protein VCSRO25_3402 [Vibrio cholerae]|uniref:hypothetical protein n=1 Tax=Vibrio harveyi group TaxID=717610 RepID=UPI001DDD1E6C|nr:MULTISPECIES: hypothetical protein [Vibrio harveyi group]EMA2414875.1 hypothetical protein [Vibrio vulnificus]GHY73447.1 hypothetical protein VCSRO25_3402 [Vibrio cholerae]EGR2232576.1 hypothetical protein [Vibrio parahaemolyticus]WHP63917.1 hypothetical protein QMY49_05075 [Vibrio harveyi]HCD1298848.1 hypothetical protein [Vibrio parahaemolyticus]
MKITNKNNKYLVNESEKKELYVSELERSINILSSFMTPTQLKNLKLDLQLEGETFNEAKYIQAACETSISATLANLYPNCFKYEHKVNPPKDVDCAFEVDGFQFNVEIKCADYSKKNKIDGENAFKLGALGRLSDFQDVAKQLQELFENVEDSSGLVKKPLILQQHMDNKLKDFLLSAHSKFSSTIHLKTLNILVVCCDDTTDMQKWFHYMYGVQGLFRQDSFHPNAEYNRVDVVILTNLYHRHYNYYEKDKVEGHWDFYNAFNLICSNPFRMADKKNEIIKLTNTIHNHSIELSQYKVPHELDELRISTYVVEELSNKGLYYFQPRI